MTTPAEAGAAATAEIVALENTVSSAHFAPEASDEPPVDDPAEIDDTPPAEVTPAAETAPETAPETPPPPAPETPPAAPVPTAEQIAAFQQQLMAQQQAEAQARAQYEAQVRAQQEAAQREAYLQTTAGRREAMVEIGLDPASRNDQVIFALMLERQKETQERQRLEQQMAQISQHFQQQQAQAALMAAGRQADGLLASTLRDRSVSDELGTWVRQQVAGYIRQGVPPQQAVQQVMSPALLNLIPKKAPAGAAESAPKPPARPRILQAVATSGSLAGRGNPTPKPTTGSDLTAQLEAMERGRSGRR